ncbi:hypothetical protein ERW51_11975 [Aliivibrio finisterrensis]|uniref:Uncharacterized protein n=1 Tax=Aliivibrio finisterrensis TaxID=511998 RepID=A0A4Q5KUD2_9GAMM|nr:hypothetical protein F8B77_01755 [Aliivibrio finisterrensis]RYU48798.1 hypothetical protein ERW49_01330 [Aliivibrio finisterrensis]RYU51607.1 hypothetical protein ERW57_09395 [Aliivibrio finisterrensis]RYU52832.1 hypothetical protein ERW56_09735 [Aliivibrio finisterrensis]RYU58330.1 hypothetical protein ERW50_09160 [Aliivibrio finisterrensis]
MFFVIFATPCFCDHCRVLKQ